MRARMKIRCNEQESEILFRKYRWYFCLLFRIQFVEVGCHKRHFFEYCVCCDISDRDNHLRRAAWSDGF